MALILAVNPGNRHSPTLARLARELPGCELIGAESAAVAIKAIKKRVPDMLLLPASPARGEGDLLAHLNTIPGGVLTVRLPAVEQADPIDLAREIRELLTGVPAALASPPPARVKAPAPPPAPARVSAPAPVPVAVPVPIIEDTPPSHLVEAAETAISWIRARRAQWSEPIEIAELEEPYGTQQPDEPRTHEPYEPRTSEPDRTHEPQRTHEPERTHEPSVPDEPKFYEPIGPYEALELPEHIEEPAPVSPARGRLPAYAAAAAALVAIVVAAMMFWPRGNGGRPAETTSAPETAASQEPAAPPAAAAPAPQPAAPQAPDTGSVAIVVPFDVTVTEEGQPIPLDDQKRAVLPPGRHRLRVQNIERGYDAIRTVTVRAAETFTLTLTPETTLTITSNEPAEVLVDGTRAGDTPFEGRVPLGPHTVTVRTAGAERQLPIEATSKPIQLEVDFSKP